MPLPRPDRSTRRVLALDGGGIHGLFTLEVLAELETRLRAEHGGGRADYRLCDYFDLVAGTSTGGIIAAITVAHLRFGLQAVLSFWLAYILTRPLGAAIGGKLTA